MSDAATNTAVARARVTLFAQSLGDQDAKPGRVLVVLDASLEDVRAGRIKIYTDVDVIEAGQS